MPRTRIKPPKFCGVPMFRTNFGWRLKVGNWLCNILESKDEVMSKYILWFMGGDAPSGLVKTGVWRDVKAQASANAAQRWIAQLGADASKLAGRRAA